MCIKYKIVGQKWHNKVFSNLIKYLGKNEFLRKTILACLLGAQMDSIHEKNRGRNSCDILSQLGHPNLLPTFAY